MSVIISIQIEDDVIDELTKWGYDPSEYILSATMTALSREKNRRALAYFRDNRFDDPTIKADEIIRDDRDSH